MAGTIQSLILTPPSPTPTLFHHRLPPHFPSKHALFYSRSVCVNNNRPVFGPVKACGASDQTSGNGVNKANTGNGFTWLKPLSNFAANNFLPLALISGVALGFANPTLGCVADSYNLSKLSTFGIFLISGLTLKSEEIGGAVEAWPVGIYGLVSILLFTPYFSRLMLQIQLQPQEFVTGLAIFSCMPTTLSSGVALTQLAKGNTALALMMTVISNMLGILAVPFSITKFIADGIGVSVPTKQLFRSLILTLLIPLIFGKISRESFKGVANFIDQNNKLFSRISAIFLSLVPWMQVSRSRSLLLMVKPEVFLIAIGLGMILHFMLLAYNVVAIQILGAISGGSQSVFSKRENVSAALLVASQKTLPVMVAVVEPLGGALGETSLLVLPCVAAHLNQIIIDSFLVNIWISKDLPSPNPKIAGEAKPN